MNKDIGSQTLIPNNLNYTDGISGSQKSFPKWIHSTYVFEWFSNEIKVPIPKPSSNIQLKYNKKITYMPGNYNWLLKYVRRTNKNGKIEIFMQLKEIGTDLSFNIIQMVLSEG